MKPKPTKAQGFTFHPTPRQLQLKGSGSGSWWANFATGDRRDAAYMAEAESHVPKQIDPMVLKEWVGAA